MGLAGYLPPVVAEVVGEIGKYSTAMGEVKAEMTGLEAANAKLAAAGKVAMTGLAIGIAAVGYESVKMAMNFDQTMEQIHTQAGASQAEVEQLKDKVLALAPAVGIGPEKLAEGLYHIESTGMRGAAAMDVLTQAAHLAKIGVADLDDVTYAMSGVMSIGMKDVHSAADAISFMNATVGMGDMRMSQLTAAIGTGILPSMKSAGLGMIDFAAALATIADNSTPADEGATRLRMTIAMMAAPSGPAAEALRKIGLSSTALATDMRQPNGLLVAVEDLRAHLGALNTDAEKTAANATLEKAFGGGKTSGSILTLLDEVDKLKGKYEQAGDAAKRAAATEDAWAQQQKQFKQKWDELVAKVDVYGIKIGNYLIPKIMDAIDWTSKHKDAIKDVADVIAGPLALAIAAYIVSLGKAALANIAATWEFLIVAAAIGFAAYEIMKLNDRLNELGVSWGQFFKISGEMIWDWYRKYVDPIFTKVMDFFGFVDKHLPGGGPVDISGTGIVTGATSGSAGATGAVSGGIKHYADGGMVDGLLGTPQLAVVHGGERVLTADQVAAMGLGGGSSSGSNSGSPAVGGGPITLHARFVYPDGKAARTESLRYSRRAGISPSTLFPDSVSGLTR
jgi:TP901 family phage tail tape measure protein